MHGQPKRSWTRLAPGRAAAQGNNQIIVEGPVSGWQVRPGERGGKHALCLCGAAAGAWECMWDDRGGQGEGTPIS